jgi:hypothetical protein
MATGGLFVDEGGGGVVSLPAEPADGGLSMSGRITRRSAMGLLGVGGLAGAVHRVGNVFSAASVPSPVPEALRAGTRFGRWTIAAVQPVKQGVLRVDVRESDGQTFALEILARDPSSASRPPAEVGALAIYVCNGGDGWLPTVEEQGLAAMTLAALLEKHGQTGPIEGLLTHGERVVAHGDILRAAFIA